MMLELKKQNGGIERCSMGSTRININPHACSILTQKLPKLGSYTYTKGQ